MEFPPWIHVEADKTLKRILPRIEKTYYLEIQSLPEQWAGFKERLVYNWENLFGYLHHLYGWQYDFFYHLEMIVESLVRNWSDRPEELKELDAASETAPYWYLSQEMVGGVLYVDLFSENLKKLKEHIQYFKQLGLTYLHLMPLFAVPHGENDGGYAVSDYRVVNPDIGSMEELAQLASELRDEGIALALDFVFNHTSEHHAWAQKARVGDPEYQNFYHTFPDRSLPDQYQRHLRDVFPTVRRGSFNFNVDMQRYVWTTFNNFQWDLNYGNPEVFRAMAEEMIFIANQGVQILRLDAVAFIWKQLGTPCENLPEAHIIISAFNTIARIVAPSLLFKSEAIVHPDEVVKYIHPQECRLSYNPLLMTLIWEALATRDVRLLNHALQTRMSIPSGCSWVNYLRCHDDIGWTFDDDEARSIGIDPIGHRKFLSDFYTGGFGGSFARGVPFQFNPETEDVRISGTLASLAGLEQALELKDSELIDLAFRRINLLRSIMLSVGGIPLIYLGDEWGKMNDYTYLTDPNKLNDSRWVHRSKKNWEADKYLANGETLEWRFFKDMVKLIELRKSLNAFYNGGMEIISPSNPHVFVFMRKNRDAYILVINNFSENPQHLPAKDLFDQGLTGDWQDVITEKVIPFAEGIALEGYQYLWLQPIP